MATIFELLLQDATARLQATPAWPPAVGNIRRKRRTEITEQTTPAVQIIDGIDEPSGYGKACYAERSGNFVVALYVRDDDGQDVIDAMKAEVMRRLSDDATAYGYGARLEPGRVLPESEIANQDAYRIEMEFRFRYQVARWTLDTVPT